MRRESRSFGCAQDDTIIVADALVVAFRWAFEIVKKDFVGARLETIKEVVVGVIKAEISKHTGLHL